MAASSTFSTDRPQADDAAPRAARVPTGSLGIAPNAYELDLEVTVRSDVVVLVRRPIEPRASRRSAEESTDLRVRLEGDFVVIARDIVTGEVSVDTQAPEMPPREPELDCNQKKEG